MKIFLKVKPNAKIAKVKKIDETHFEIWIKEPAKEGKANGAVIKAMAKHFGVSKSSVSIVAGVAAKQKIIEIE